MNFMFSIKQCICLAIIILFSQLSYGQHTISKKINENLTQIKATTQKAPLQEVTEDNPEIPVAKSVLNHRQILELNPTQIQSIKNNDSEYLRMSIPIEGQDVELQLYKANIFTNTFRAELTSNPNQDLEIDKGLHYRGIVADNPGSIATISFIGDEIAGGIYYNDKQLSLTKLRGSDYHILFENQDLKHSFEMSCQAIPIENSRSASPIRESVESASRVLDCVGVHVEVDQSFYQDQGSDINATITYVTALFGQVTAMFANESIPVEISFLRVWDSPDPYAPGNELNDLTGQGYGTTNGNIVHLLHAHGGGGVAYLNALCDNTFNTGVSNIFGFFNNIPAYSWDVLVVTHEIGHNLSSPHTHDCVWNGNNTQIDDCGNKFFDEDGDPATPPNSCYNNLNQIIPANGGTVMSYCHLIGGVGINLGLGFGQQPGDAIRNFTASQNCGNFCNVVCPAQVTTPYAGTEDICAGIVDYTLPTSYPGLVLDNNTAATYRWSTGTYISAGGTPINGNTYTLSNPAGCDPVIERLYLNAGCFTDGLNDIDAGILTLNVYPDPAQFTVADLITVSNENTCNEPQITSNCAGVGIIADPNNPTFPLSGTQSGTANYTITYTPQAGAPDCCTVDPNGELVSNGDFEAGTTDWIEYEEVPTGTVNPNPFGIIGVSNNVLNGTSDAWFGGWGGTSYLTISQDITIPPTCGTAELTFDYGMSCANGGITLYFAVNGNILGSVACVDGVIGSLPPFDLIAAGVPSGTPVTFTIIGDEDGTGSDSPDIYIDNVSIITTGCVAPLICEIPVSATYDCQQTCAGIDLNINFDGFPSQTSWEITDANTGGLMTSGGSYGSQAGNSNLSLPDVSCLPDGCYELTFYDAINNGMCPFRSTASSSGTFVTPGTVITPGTVVATLGTVVAPGLCGNYSLTDINGTTLASGGGAFGSSQSNTFCLTGGAASLWQPDNSNINARLQPSLTGLRIFPTLTNDKLFIEMPEVAQGQLNILDINGQIIQQYEQTTTQMQINVSDLPAGIYFVQMMANDGILVEKFVKN